MAAETSNREVADALAGQLSTNYIFPDIAEKMSASLKDSAKNGSYDEVAPGEALADQLTKELFAIAHDEHIRVRYLPEVQAPEPPRDPNDAPSADELDKMRHHEALVNFGFAKVERLPGNIGYIEMRGFSPAEIGGDTAVAAMAFLANANALIFDLRRNGGGASTMIDLLCSFLFPPGQSVHINDFEFRGQPMQQRWLSGYVPGKSLAGKDIYILTSNRTFSAAEEFSYDLQNLKRATIIGETTGGGANPGDFIRISDHYRAFIPNGRAVSPVTHTNWEGIGVKPDIQVPADQALTVAQITALKKLAATDLPRGLKEEVANTLAHLEKKP